MRIVYIVVLVFGVFAAACAPASGAFGDDAGGIGADPADAGPSIAEGDFINGDFEQGPGVGWTEQPGPLIHPAADYGAQAYSGRMVARMGPMGDSGVIVLEQTVRLAASATTLSLANWVDSEELCDVPWYDNMSLSVNGQVVEENDRLCNYDNSDGWFYSTTDISPWAGQVATFRFRLSTVSGDALASTVYLDAVRIQ